MLFKNVSKILTLKISILAALATFEYQGYYKKRTWHIR